MWIKLLAIALFLAQVYLTFNGVGHFGKYPAPVVLYGVSMGIALLYFVGQLRPNSGAPLPARKRNFPATALWCIAGMLTFALAYEELRKLFVEFPDPARWSDVIPQLETLYKRFSQGEFPYTPVYLPTHAPFPVYMPLHWLPIGLADLLGIGSRWLGYGMLGLAGGLYGVWVGRQPLLPAVRIIALFLPSVGLWGYILWGGLELPVSLETIIAAYYLVLAVGLLERNLFLITVGLICCLLSRYTLVFWLPLLAWVLYREKTLRENLRAWGAVALAIVLLYGIPFLLKEPGILAEGIAYHNGSAVAEWNGYGDPPVSWTMESGIYFAVFMKENFNGSMEQRVALARMVQGTVMLLLLGFGLWAWRRWKSRLNPYDLCLVMLYATIANFYFFSPITFKYYYLVVFGLSGVVTARILLDRDDARAG